MKPKKPKDKRYQVVTILINGDYVKNFLGIFDHIPISVVAIDIGSNYVRFKRLINNPFNLRLRDINILANLFGIGLIKMVQLIQAQKTTYRYTGNNSAR
jgi:hypothetical protein